MTAQADIIPTARGTRWQIAESLRRRIIGGEISRGQRLPSERDLAEQLGVARATVREAQQILKDEGILTTVRGRSGGAVVTDLMLLEELWYERIRQNPAELDEVFDFRLAVETRSAYLAATRRDEDDLAVMQHSIDLLKSKDGASPAVFREADAEFHNAVAHASRNERLGEAIRASRGEIFFPFDTLPHPVYIAPTLEGHTAILDAIRRMDGGAAAAAMESHLEHTRIELRTIAFMTANRVTDVSP
jgi:GntR family transcriptional repressor for pyruvate dehydrogenase complex